MEAHARDQWPLGERRSCLDQHKTLQERISAARLKAFSAAMIAYPASTTR